MSTINYLPESLFKKNELRMNPLKLEDNPPTFRDFKVIDGIHDFKSKKRLGSKADYLIDELIRKSYRKNSYMSNGDRYGDDVIPSSIGPHPMTDMAIVTYWPIILKPTDDEMTVMWKKPLENPRNFMKKIESDSTEEKMQLIVKPRLSGINSHSDCILEEISEDDMSIEDANDQSDTRTSSRTHDSFEEDVIDVSLNSLHNRSDSLL